MTDEDLIEEMNGEDIVSAVAAEFGNVATNPYGVHPFPVGRVLALKNGYPKDILETLPDSLCDSFTGAGYSFPSTNITEGEIILDLGCGAGLDLYFYSRAASSKGKVYGVDISPEMVEKAKSNMETLGIKNVEVMLGSADKIPVPDNSIDIVVCNGIFNLMPNKLTAVKEVFRVLKPSGRLFFSEIVMEKPVAAKTIKEWLKCTGGAIHMNEFIDLLNGEGFERSEVVLISQNPRTQHPLAACATIKAYKPK